MQETMTSASADQPSETIVTLVADLEGTSPTELTPPLYSAVDPEALDSLFHAPATDGFVQFRYRGYEIVVESGGDVTITSVDVDH